MPDMLGSQVQLSAVKEKDAEEDQAEPATGQHETKPVGIAFGASL